MEPQKSISFEVERSKFDKVAALGGVSILGKSGKAPHGWGIAHRGNQGD